MTQQKGFSLIEVLTSLLLVTTLAITLLQQQSQSKFLLNQLLIRIQATHYLDHVEETITAQIKKLPPTPALFHLVVVNKDQDLRVTLAWHEQAKSITRQHNSIRLFH